MCLPEQLEAKPATGEVACRILFVLLPDWGSGDKSCVNDGPGLSLPLAATVTALRTRYSLDPSRPVCEIAQLPKSSWSGPSCDQSAEAGWCYISEAASPSCHQEVHFSMLGTPPTGAMAVLVCP